MKIHVKAMLLSGFVLPGLGQLYKGNKVKGALLIVLVNIFLLATLFLVLQSLGPLMIAAKVSGTAGATELLEKLQAKSPAGRWLLACFVGIWLYSSFDAAFGNSPKGDTEHRIDSAD